MAFNYKIVKHIAVLSESDQSGYDLEVNLISYNGRKPRVDIRRWDKIENRMLKGITLTDEELEALKITLANM